MKKVLLCLSLFLVGQHVFAQKDSLQLDENNAYVYYKVISNANLPADTVYKRAWDFTKNLNKASAPVKGQADRAFNINGKFLVYSGVSLVRKESGDIKYTFNFQAVEGKYRYKLSGFVFTPYKRDRYGNMATVPGVEIPLEKFTAKYTKKEQDAILDQIATQCLTIEARLKQAVNKIITPKKQTEVKKVNTGNW